MPCNTVSETLVDLGKTDPDLIHASLKEMGLSPNRNGNIIYFSGGYFEVDTEKQNHRITWRVSNAEERTTELKRQYSAEVVKSQAKRFGWQLTQKSRFEFEVTKR